VFFLGAKIFALWQQKNKKIKKSIANFLNGFLENKNKNIKFNTI
jgi:hypothetical protein